ncbi:MAG: Coenzyme F420 hydrogenase/dehydrogenase, beta subunit C-terminal domain [Tissierellaceae bacterium]|jgi:coenzyme F420-reducing hydrogenase beta subunit
MIDKKIKLNRDCMGCHGCMNICPENCISMEIDKEGFLYPKVDYELCIKCKKCINTCPIINKTIVDNEPLAYACVNKNEEIRLDSSSGGVFTLVAEYVIDKGGIVFGACFNDKFELEHNYVKTKEELSKLRGSKYLQSRIGNSYNQAKDFLDIGKKVLFTGTPCQIAGLKSFLGRKIYNDLVTIDIICHGVPSPEVWRKYVEFREKEAKSSTQRIDFRQKNEGWKRYSVSFLFKNNAEYRQNFRNDLYMRSFLKDVCLRPSCYECEFKTLNRQSDITLADFWGIQNILPEMDDDKGTSLIFVNSDTGREIFNSILKGMKFKEVDINEAIKYNPSAIKSVKEHPNRKSFFYDLNNLQFDKLVKKHCTDKLGIRIKNKAKVIIRGIFDKMGLLGIAKKIVRRS